MALKNGNLTGLAAIRDPFNNGTPFASNQIPVSRISPVAASLLGFTSDPNLPGSGTAGLGRNFVVNNPSKEFNNRYTAKVQEMRAARL